MSISCRVCGKHPNESGAVLTRVNPKGEVGIFQCYPSCESELTMDEKIQLAITPKEAVVDAVRELDAGGGEYFASVDDLVKDLFDE